MVQHIQIIVDCTAGRQTADIKEIRFCRVCGYGKIQPFKQRSAAVLVKAAAVFSERSVNAAAGGQMMVQNFPGGNHCGKQTGRKPVLMHLTGNIFHPAAIVAQKHDFFAAFIKTKQSFQCFRPERNAVVKHAVKTAKDGVIGIRNL